MDVLLFMLVSTIEWAAMIVLIFAEFRFLLNSYKGQVLFSSFMLSVLSYLIFGVLDLSLYGALIQLPVVYVLFWQMFRIHYFYAGIMVVNGYLSYGLIQATFLYAFQMAGVSPVPNTPMSFVVQLLTAAFAFLAAWWMKMTNVGFSFVPDTHRVKITWNRLHLRLVIMTIAGYLTVSSFNLVYFSGHTMLLIFLLSTLIFGFLQYFVVQKEQASA